MKNFTISLLLLVLSLIFAILTCITPNTCVTSLTCVLYSHLSYHCYLFYHLYICLTMTLHYLTHQYYHSDLSSLLTYLYLSYHSYLYFFCLTCITPLTCLTILTSLTCLTTVMHCFPAISLSLPFLFWFGTHEELGKREETKMADQCAECVFDDNGPAFNDH